MTKRWHFPKKERFSFPIADGRIKTLGEDQDLRTSTLVRPRPIQWQGHWLSWRIRRVSSTTSRFTSGCLWSYERFLIHVGKFHMPPSRWTPGQTLLAQRRIIPSSAEENWRNQNYSRILMFCAYGKFDTASSWRPYCRRRWEIHYSTAIWFTSSFLCLKLWKFCQRKQRWRMGKIGENFGVELDKSQKWEKGDRWSKDVGRYISFCIINGHLSFEKCWIGGKAPEIQRSSCAPWWYCERRFRFLCSIHWKRIFSITNDSSKSHGYHLQIAGLRRTSSRRSISTYPENGRCSQIVENSKIGVSRHLDSSTTTNGQNHGPIWKTQSFLLSRICTVIFWQDYYGKGNLRKSYWNMDGRKFPNWECLFVHREKGLFLFVYVDDIKLAGKKHNLDPTWKVLNKEVDLGEPTSFLDHVYLGCTPSAKQAKTLWTITVPCLNREFQRCGSDKSPFPQNLRVSSWSYLWHGWSCKEVCGTILWVGKQDPTTLQSIHSMHRWSPLQRGGNKICWRIVNNLLSNCSEMLMLGTNWTTRYFMVSKQARAIHNKMDQSLWQTSESFDPLHSSHMWETLQNNADWDCFRTLIVREILKIQNPLLEEHCAYLEATHLFQ